MRVGTGRLLAFVVEVFDAAQAHYRHLFTKAWAEH